MDLSYDIFLPTGPKPSTLGREGFIVRCFSPAIARDASQRA